MDAEKEFGGILLAAVDEGLQAILGDPQAKAVNWHVKRLMVLSDPGAFIRALQTIFGAQGAWIFEDAILRKLYEKVDEKYDSNNDIPFEEHVRKAQTSRLPCRKATITRKAPFSLAAHPAWSRSGFSADIEPEQYATDRGAYE